MRRSEPTAAAAGGFTLIELLLVVVVAAALSAIAVAAYGSQKEKVEISQAEGDITRIEGKISLYEATNGALPTSLAEVGEGATLDPWGNPYHYLDFTGLSNLGQVRKDRNLIPLNSDYDLFSTGPDGQWQPPITTAVSQDDIIRADNGGYVGTASDY